MGTYRKEWPCCGDVSETNAWEPEECPFCTPAAPVVAEGLRIVPIEPTEAMYRVMLAYGTKREEWRAILDAAHPVAGSPVEVVKVECRIKDEFGKCSEWAEWTLNDAKYFEDRGWNPEEVGQDAIRQFRTLYTIDAAAEPMPASEAANVRDQQPVCPGCGSALCKVTQDANSMLNAEQFDAVKLGDWYCASCPAEPVAGGKFRYFWSTALSNLAAPAAPTDAKPDGLGEPDMLWDAEDAENCYGDGPEDFANNYASNCLLPGEDIEVDVLCAYRGSTRTMRIALAKNDHDEELEKPVSWSWVGSPSTVAQSVRDAAQPAIAVEEVRDTERLDLMIAEECYIDHLRLPSGIRYRLYWPLCEVAQTEWHETPRAAIDSQLAAIASTTTTKG